MTHPPWCPGCPGCPAHTANTPLTSTNTPTRAETPPQDDCPGCPEHHRTESVYERGEHTMSESQGRSAGAPVLYRVSEAVGVLNMSKSTVYELIRSGRLKTVKEGRARLVPASAIAEYVALLMREAGVSDDGEAA